MTYPAFKTRYRELYAADPLQAFFFWWEWSVKYQGLSEQFGTQAALAVYEACPSVRLMQGTIQGRM